MTTPELLIVGRLRKAYGTRGELLVEPITDAPAAVYAAGRRLFPGTTAGDPDPQARHLTIDHARLQHDGSVVVGFAEIPDRTEAERWRGRYLLAPAGDLPQPAEGEVYLHELPGMRVLLATGEPVGDVVDVYELPQGLMLSVAGPRDTVLLPFREEFVQRVDRAARHIIATPPEGFFE